MTRIPSVKQIAELIEFVHDYAFLYEKLNIEFFSSRLYDRIDQEWLQFMRTMDVSQLNTLPIDFEEYEDCPASLRTFLNRCLRHSLSDRFARPFCQKPNEDPQSRKPMQKVKQKKMHELSAMSELILAECRDARVDRVVDIGCGLAHLGRMLSAIQQEAIQNGRNVIEYAGIEANPEFCHTARKLSSGEYQLKNTVFTAENAEQCRHVISPPNQRTAIVSLHGCGELQNTILRDFAKLAAAGRSNPLLVTVGCCYHKLKDWDNSDIDRWVLSQSVREQFRSVFGPDPRFPIPGLRLACQAKLCRWLVFTEEEHVRHRHSFASRAFVECLMQKKETEKNARVPRKQNRKLGTTVEELRTEVLRRSDVQDGEERERWGAELDSAMAEHESAIDFIEPFTALQFAMQGPIESLVLFDRLIFLHEQGLEAELIKLFDPLVSPRNIAVVARMKHTSG